MTISNLNLALSLLLFFLLALVVINNNKSKYSDKEFCHLANSVNANLSHDNTTYKYPYDDNYKPYLVLHIGPRKTSSTALQNFLINENEILQKSNYVALYNFTLLDFLRGRKSTANLALCFQYIILNKSDYINECVSVKKQFHMYLSEAIRTRTNVIISSEVFSHDIDINELMKYIGNDFNVHIVSYYRRFYSWLPSWYFQMHRRENISQIPTISQYLTLTKLYELIDYYKEVSLAGRYAIFPNVNVSFVDFLNTKESTLHQFFCKHVPDAIEICNFLDQEQYSLKVMNAGTSLDTQRIIFHVSEKIKINNNYSQYRNKDKGGKDNNSVLSKIVTNLLLQQSNASTTYYYECIETNVMDIIREVSIDVENLLENLLYHHGNNNINKDIDEHFYNTKKFCSVNVEKFIQSNQKELGLSLV